MKKSKSIMLAAAAAVASLLGAAAMPASASPFTLTNGNSSVTVDPANSDGMYNWTVDNVDQLNAGVTTPNTGQWFWYRIGSSGAQTPISSLNLLSTTLLSTSGGTNDNWANITYADVARSFQLSVTFQLSGGQAHSGSSDLSETYEITNTSSSTENFHFFDYTNLTLGGKAGGQNLTLSGLNTATQSAAGELSQTVVSGKANEYEANTFSTLLTALNGTDGLTLSGATSETNADPEYAFEWDPTLAPGQSYLITEDKEIQAVPEPTSALALLGMGGIFFTRPRRRDEDPDPRTAQVAEA
jgi:hypothetical protein